MSQIKTMIDSLGVETTDIYNQAIPYIKYIWFSGGAAIGSIIGWLLKHLKMKKEIEKLTLENVFKKMEIIEKIQSKKDIFTQNGETLSLMIDECILGLQSRNIENLKKLRDDINHFYFYSYIEAFTKYFETFSVGYSYEKKERKHFINEALIPFLKVTDSFLQVVNLEVMLNYANFSKITISKETIQFIYRFSFQNLSFWDVTTKRVVKKYFNKIII